ncbi:hypothetical protein SRHO_G00106680 [Serrasalmus rhombeus]
MFAVALKATGETNVKDNTIISAVAGQQQASWRRPRQFRDRLNLQPLPPLCEERGEVEEGSGGEVLVSRQMRARREPHCSLNGKNTIHWSLFPLDE